MGYKRNLRLIHYLFGIYHFAVRPEPEVQGEWLYILLELWTPCYLINAGTTKGYLLPAKNKIYGVNLKAAPNGMGGKAELNTHRATTMFFDKREQRMFLVKTRMYNF
jgi:hypothetical protein